jgi:hypothetical protein
MQMRARALARWAPAALGAALVAAAPATPASAAAPAREAGPVRPADLRAVEARGPVRDVVLSPARARGRAADAPARTERFRDGDGHVITVGTDLADVDLRPVAALVAGTLHRGEVERLRVRVVAMSDMPSACDPAAVACYAPEAGTEIGRARGEMIVAADDPDLAHTVVHEYGHHIDAQLWNFPAGGPCRGLDGSRRWLFARELAGGLLQEAGCGDEVPWERLLPEVFAEDFVALNGIRDWELPDLAAPTPAVLDALRADIQLPYTPRRRAVRGRLASGGRRSVTFRAAAHAFLTLTLSGSSRAGLDLELRPTGARAAVARSARAGSRERLQAVVPPGAYRVVVRATGSGGGFRLAVVND